MNSRSSAWSPGEIGRIVTSVPLDNSIVCDMLVKIDRGDDGKEYTSTSATPATNALRQVN
jgi:hypothetical protein